MEEEKKRNKNTTTETVNNGYWKDKIYCKSTFQTRNRRNLPKLGFDGRWHGFWRDD